MINRNDTSLESNDDFSIVSMLLRNLAFPFNFNGRLGRGLFWGMGIIQFFVAMALFILIFRTLDVNALEANGLRNMIAHPDFLPFAPFVISLWVIGLSVTVRRMHDRGVSGLWMLVWFIPFVGIPVIMVQTFKNAFFAGTPGPNKYGT